MRDIIRSMKEVREAPQARTATNMIPPLLEKVDPAGAVAIAIEAGSIIAFSAHYANAGVPNHTGLTRISMETRTLMIGEQVARRGAPNDGCACWLAPSMFRRVSDGMGFSDLLGTTSLESFTVIVSSDATASTVTWRPRLVLRALVRFLPTVHSQ
jgi:hypothetical protein